jgi:hypothetical protein
MGSFCSFFLGRRDPMFAMYTHMPTPPEFLVYDFGCALSEYCKCRAGSFFKWLMYAVFFCIRFIARVIGL